MKENHVFLRVERNGKTVESVETHNSFDISYTSYNIEYLRFKLNNTAAGEYKVVCDHTYDETNNIATFKYYSKIKVANNVITNGFACCNKNLSNIYISSGNWLDSENKIKDITLTTDDIVYFEYFIKIKNIKQFFKRDMGEYEIYFFTSLLSDNTGEEIDNNTVIESLPDFNNNPHFKISPDTYTVLTFGDYVTIVKPSIKNTRTIEIAYVPFVFDTYGVYVVVKSKSDTPLSDLNIARKTYYFKNAFMVD